MTNFQPNVASDWTRAVREPPRVKPAPRPGPLSPAEVLAFQTYNLTLPPLMTPDIRRAHDLLDKTLLFNQHRPLGGRRIAFVTGKPHSGKTTAVLAKAVLDTGHVWAETTGRTPPAIPWVYVEATPEGRGRALAQAICRFVGLPFGPTESAATLIGRIALVAQPMGLRGIIIDDVHFLRAQTPRDRETLANVVKGLISSVPATFVFIGVDLPHSPLVAPTATGDAPSDQLANRADWITFPSWPKTDAIGDVPHDWIALLANLRAQVALPRGIEQWRLDRRATVTYLIEGSAGRPAAAVEWTILAANHAIETGTTLNREALLATRNRRPSR